jgi:hypothetical protein
LGGILLNIKHTINNLESLSIREKATITNADKPVLTRTLTCANYLGRRILVGRIFGAIRFAAGVILAAISSVSALFSLVISGVIRPFNRSGSDHFYNFAGMSGLFATACLMHTVRGLVEAIPIVGYWTFVKYDMRKYNI